MKRKEVINKLEDIKQILDFQIYRLKDKKSINKNLTLKSALDFVERDLIKLNRSLRK
jgi:hypothetical protein